MEFQVWWLLETRSNDTNFASNQVLHQLTFTEPCRFADVDSYQFWHSSAKFIMVLSIINYLKNLCNND